MAFLGEMWSAVAGTVLLFGQGWAVRLAGVFLIVRTADTQKGFDLVEPLVVCAVTAVLVGAFKLWLSHGQDAAPSQGPEASQQERGPAN